MPPISSITTDSRYGKTLFRKGLVERLRSVMNAKLKFHLKNDLSQS